MPFYGWPNCPPAVREQVDDLVVALTRGLGNQLTGIYLHGSLAMGCFNPRRSDLDLLVLITDPLSLAIKREIIEDLLACSKQPSPVEISFVTHAQLFPWRYPTPFELHYSEGWRDRYTKGLQSDAWQKWNEGNPVDPDLAAHVTMTRARGVCLAGLPIDAAFPLVPNDDYRASVAADIDESLNAIGENPVYTVLNCSRTAAYLRDGQLFSKAEGGRWALDVLPADFHGLIAGALIAYAAGSEAERFDAESLDSFAEYMKEALNWESQQ